MIAAGRLTATPSTATVATATRSALRRLTEVRVSIGAGRANAVARPIAASGQSAISRP